MIRNLKEAIAFAKANRNVKSIKVNKWSFGRIAFQLERMSFVDSWSPPSDMNTRKDKWAKIDKECWYQMKKQKQLRRVEIMGIPLECIK